MLPPIHRDAGLAITPDGIPCEVDFRLYPQLPQGDRPRRERKKAVLEPKIQQALTFIQNSRDQEDRKSEEAFEVAHGLFNYVIKNYRSKGQVLSAIKTSFERAFVELERDLARVDEHSSQLAIIKPTLSRKIQEQDMMNRQIANRLTEFQESSKVENLSIEAQLEASKESRKQTNLTKIQTAKDIQLINKALAAQDEALKEKRLCNARVTLMQQVQEAEAKAALLMSEVKMVMEDLRFNQGQQEKLAVHQKTQRDELSRLNSQLDFLAPRERLLCDEVRQLMRNRSIQKIVSRTTDEKARSINHRRQLIGQWADRVEWSQALDAMASGGGLGDIASYVKRKKEKKEEVLVRAMSSAETLIEAIR